MLSTLYASIDPGHADLLLL